MRGNRLTDAVIFDNSSTERCVSLRGVCASLRGCFFINGRDADEGDVGLVALQFAVAFGQDADGGEVVFLELIGQGPEPPAEHLQLHILLFQRTVCMA